MFFGLTPWERATGDKIIAALDAQRKEFEADPSKARVFLTRLGYWQNVHQWKGQGNDCSRKAADYGVGDTGISIRPILR